MYKEKKKHEHNRKIILYSFKWQLFHFKGQVDLNACYVSGLINEALVQFRQQKILQKIKKKLAIENRNVTVP